MMFRVPCPSALLSARVGSCRLGLARVGSGWLGRARLLGRLRAREGGGHVGGQTQRGGGERPARARARARARAGARARGRARARAAAVLLGVQSELETKANESVSAWIYTIGGRSTNDVGPRDIFSNFLTLKLPR